MPSRSADATLKERAAMLEQAAAQGYALADGSLPVEAVAS